MVATHSRIPLGGGRKTAPLVSVFVGNGFGTFGAVGVLKPSGGPGVELRPSQVALSDGAPV